MAKYWGAREVQVAVLALTTLSCFFLLGDAFLALWRGRPSNEPLAYVPSDQLKDASASESTFQGHRVDIWTAAQQPLFLEDNQNVPEPFNSTEAFQDVTIRQTVRLTSSTYKIRLTISNTFGAGDLAITKVTVAHPLPIEQNGRTIGSSRIHPDRVRTLTFGNNTSTLVPPAGLAISDPIEDFPTRNGELISINLYLGKGYVGDVVTAHRSSRTSSWFAKGDHTTESDLRFPKSKPHWYFISAVAGWQPIQHGAIVALGDSITDGRGSHMNQDERWPDFLFNRLQKSSDPNLKSLSVINQGISGNRMLGDGLGPNLVARLDRDVMGHNGIRYAIVLEGVNDIGHAGNSNESQQMQADRFIAYYKEVITRLHESGIPVFGGTIMPFGCRNETWNNFAGSTFKEEGRLTVNEWIRNSNWFDAVVDFDEIMRDPKHHSRMRHQLHCGDCLHPNGLGAQKMADEFPLELFNRFRDGV
jgi:lysophospholipase L1-like esterase